MREGLLNLGGAKQYLNCHILPNNELFQRLFVLFLLDMSDEQGLGNSIIFHFEARIGFMGAKFTRSDPQLGALTRKLCSKAMYTEH